MATSYTKFCKDLNSEYSDKALVNGVIAIVDAHLSIRSLRNVDCDRDVVLSIPYIDLPSEIVQQVRYAYLTAGGKSGVSWKDMDFVHNHHTNSWDIVLTPFNNPKPNDPEVVAHRNGEF